MVRVSFLVMCGIFFVSSSQAFAISQVLHDRKVIYEEGRVTHLSTEVLHVTEICLVRSDSIQSIQGGDASSWEITLSQAHSQCLFIKPKRLHSETNLLIEGARYDYWLHLVVDPARVHDVYRLTWVLADSVKKSKKPKKKDPHFLSRVRQPLYALGDSRLLPDWSFTDNQLTYFHWGALLPIPVVYASSYRHGPFHMINFRMRGRTLIALERASYWRFVSGSKSCLALTYDHRLLKRESSFWHHAHCMGDVQ